MGVDEPRRRKGAAALLNLFHSTSLWALGWPVFQLCWIQAQLRSQRLSSQKNDAGLSFMNSLKKWGIHLIMVLDTGRISRDASVEVLAN